MMDRIGRLFSRIARRYLPDAFVFAILLTVLTFILGMAVQRQSAVDMTRHFGDGMWRFLEFAMQMVLILVTGSALARSPAVESLLRLVARLARTPSQAIVIATVVMMAACWLNWGFGLIVGALVARELARNVRGVHYPLLVASAYSGFVVWHAGLSGSIPLKIAGADRIMTEFADGAVVPASATIFAWQNLALVLVLLAVVPLVNRAMRPRRMEDLTPADTPEPVQAAPVRPWHSMTPAERLENSPVLSLVIGLLVTAAVVAHFAGGGAIGLNIVILIFLGAGVVLQGTPIRYVRAVNEGVSACGGIVLQFPFYAGIMGMMAGSGLAVTLSQAFVSISNATTFPLFTFLSAGVVNFFVPSGGGQWLVQGPIVMPAAKALGVPYSTAAMAIAWGDAWTNLVQPFWALPLLAVANLSIRDIMGYTAVVLVVTGAIASAFMLVVF